MTENIRSALVEDASAACELMRRSISQCCIADHNNDIKILSAWLANKTPAKVADWFSSPANFSVVAVRDETVLGVVLMTRIGKIALFYVDPDSRNAGIGSKLLDHVESKAGKFGIGSLRVDSTVTASRFYLRHGFSSTGTKRTAYGTEGQVLVKCLGRCEARAH